ncbi:GNAT family N-acetyltransferase [Streptomyces prunicolor]|uniref:GNAT family N-acetyltransferase n=1 Tax=Streptomyces prunicolor TaxID=67348 RepID=UPI0009963D55|nr:GNAT family N-acetyltransferase [Streptomyces prunicolor]
MIPVHGDRAHPEQLRAGTEEDLYEITRIDAEAFPSDPYPYFVVRQFFDLSGGRLLVLDDSHTLHGYVLATPPDAGLSWILSLGVPRDLRGRGLGRRLMVEMVSRLRAEGAREIKLTVDPDNDPAVLLYRHLGFLAVGDLLKDYFGPGEHRIRMALDLCR